MWQTAAMSSRELLLDTARRMVAEEGRLPSLDRLARATGLSKGGVMHHVPSRSALVQALILAALEETDRELRGAVADGAVVATWLQLSGATSAGGTPVAALARIALDAANDLGETAHALAAANERWEALLAAELGSAQLARIVRLVGDGVLLSGLLGGEPTAVSVDDLRAALRLP
jgi:AcrR family transcriptional regulator